MDRHPDGIPGPDADAEGASGKIEALWPRPGGGVADVADVAGFIPRPNRAPTQRDRQWLIGCPSRATNLVRWHS